MSPGMFVACGSALPYRIIENHVGKKITEATFSSPVRSSAGTRLRSRRHFVTFESKRDWRLVGRSPGRGKEA